MKLTVKKSLCFILALIMIFSSVGVSCFANAVGKVASLKLTSVTENSVTLSWTKTQDADGYRIYRYNPETKKWHGIKNTTALSFTDKSLSSGETYSYGVRAIEVVNGKNVYGEASNVVKALTKPGAITQFKATEIKRDSVTLSWNKAAGATGYALYQYNTSTKRYDRIAVPASNTYTVKGLKAASSYTFGVRAYYKDSSVVYGKAYENLVVKTPNLDKVKNLRLDAFNEKAYRIAWDKVDGAEGYQVALYDTAAKKWKSLGTTTKTSAVLNAKNVNANYQYTVRAYAKNGSSYVFGALADSVVAFAKPATPSEFEGAENSSNGISLRWNKISGVAGYEIYTYDAVNGKWVYLAETSSNTYNVKGITQSSHYKYKVRAYKLSSNKKFYGDFCESITVEFHGGKNDSIYSEEMEKSGVFGYLYDPAGKYFYTADDPWQRNVGYNSVFDTTAPLALINFDTLRLRFPYGDKDWMIQLWKGQYGLIFYGAEVGVYTKPGDRALMHYDCASDDEMLKMSLVFNEYRNGKWEQRFTRPYGYYWWCTGFLPGNKFGDFSVIRLDMRITAKDYDMLSGIKSALTENGISYKATGLDVYFTFS